MAVRFIAGGALAAGLALAPVAPGWAVWVAAVAAGSAGAVGAGSPGVRWAGPLLAACAAVVVGLVGGDHRLAAIDAAALQVAEGRTISVRGHVLAPPRAARGQRRIRLATPSGRIEILAPDRGAPPRVGREIAAHGVVRAPPRWLRASLQRGGIRRRLHADAVRITGRTRGGLVGVLDGVRDRAEGALGRGVPAREAALLRGMVLGQDAGIDARTTEEWKRAGLAHLLAVSGQNVLLLSLLAWAVLAVAGVPFTPRLIVIGLLIAVYVPLTGAGPSIQRAAVMGLAGVLAAIAGRPETRAWGLLLAAAGTLAANPRASGDVGWQLSFAAVVGIMVWSGPVKNAIVDRLGSGPGARSIAEGVAATVAATLATAPLMAHHFSAVSVAALPANVAALPAVAPVMWLGMLAAAAGQLPALPVEVLTLPAAALAGWIREVGAALAGPGWAQADVELPGGASVVALYAALGALTWASRAWAARRAGLVGSPAGRRIAAATGALVLVAVAWAAPGLRPPSPGLPDGALVRLEALDVGQGDALLIREPGGRAVLVDGGFTGTGVEDHLRGRGVRSLAAAVITHPDADHMGGIEELLGRVPVSSLLYQQAPPRVLNAARSAGAAARRVAAGDVIALGPVRLEVLWPPAGDPSAGSEPNARAVVLRLEAGRRSALLTADAEAEAVPYPPEPVEVLKVAHHGSRDDGLEAALNVLRPRVAVISVGERNRFGHPTPDVLAALHGHGAQIRRTDRDGTVTLDGTPQGWVRR